jgi:hypothetical protein
MQLSVESARALYLTTAAPASIQIGFCKSGAFRLPGMSRLVEADGLPEPDEH